MITSFPPIYAGIRKGVFSGSCIPSVVFLLPFSLKRVRHWHAPLPGISFQTVMRFSRYCSDRIVRYVLHEKNNRFGTRKQAFFIAVSSPEYSINSIIIRMIYSAAFSGFLPLSLVFYKSGCYD